MSHRTFGLRISALLAAALWSCCHDASAGQWYPAPVSPMLVTQVASGTDGNLVWTDTGLGNSEGCADNTHGRIDDSSPNLQRILALATAALAGGLKLQVWISGCLSSGGSTVPKITDIRIAR